MVFIPPSPSDLYPANPQAEDCWVLSVTSEHHSLWCGMSLWPAGDNCPAVSPHNSLCTLDSLCKLCSALTTISVCYQCHFQHKSKTQPSQATVNKLNSVLAKNSTRWRKGLCKPAHVLAGNVKRCYRIQSGCHSHSLRWIPHPPSGITYSSIKRRPIESSID